MPPRGIAKGPVRSNQSEHIYDMHLFFFGRPADMLLVFYEDIDFRKTF